LLAQPVAAQRQRALDTDVLGKLLRQYDKNGDGKVQKDEYPRTAEGFTNLDRNADGAVDEKDLSVTGRRAQPQPMLRRAAQAPPKAGQDAPDFDLPMLGMKGTTVKLSSFRGDRPVALIFGSYT
jgi:hypothetical protein